MPPRAARALRTKKPIKYITETDEDGNEIISSEVEDDVKPDVKPAAKRTVKPAKKVVKSEDKDPDFAAEAEIPEEEESDKENVQEVTPQSKNKKRKTSKLDDSDEEEASDADQDLVKKKKANSDEEESADVSIVSERIGSSLARDLEEMRQRAKKARAEKDADFDRLLNEVDNVRESPIPQPKKRTSKKNNKIDGFTVEQWRRQLGNEAKSTISFQKWTIAAQTHFVHTFTSDAFRALIVPHADEVYPKEFNANTPIIMASTHTKAKAGEIMGSSKLTGGSRYGTWSARKVDYIYVAEKKELRVWFTMM